MSGLDSQLSRKNNITRDLNSHYLRLLLFVFHHLSQMKCSVINVMQFQQRIKVFAIIQSLDNGMFGCF
jgi:hypothetical protein